MDKIIPYSRQTIDQSDLLSVKKVLKSDFLTQGSEVTDFENALSRYCHSKYTVVFNSGTAALHAAYFAVGLLRDQEFITSPMTFAATANAGLYLGAKPVFADIDSRTGNIDVFQVGKLVNQKTKLIVPVHYGGLPVDLDAIKKIADKYGLFIIEDACHALGAEYKNTKIGSCFFSDATIFSFHSVKQITTGEGGAVTTNNKTIYERMKVFRTHGINKNRFLHKTSNDGEWFYEMQELGFNYRLTDIQAALGLSQLRKLDDFVKKRKKIAAIYRKTFNNNLFFDLIEDDRIKENAYHLFPILLKDRYVKKRKEIFERLRRNNIGVQVHYIPVYWHPYYAKLGYNRKICPNAEKFYQREISIPLYPSMKRSEINYVIKAIYKVFNKI